MSTFLITRSGQVLAQRKMPGETFLYPLSMSTLIRKAASAGGVDMRDQRATNF